ncbi:DASH complex subunit Dad1-domain-containing protein [Xylaria cubensis]|nr:DASH complex subunit Dad1-domain-containing protein [Xylaria cubensis]
MASHSRSASAISGSYGPGAAASTREKTHFEMQREALIGEIAMVRLLSLASFLFISSPFVSITRAVTTYHSHFDFISRIGALRYTSEMIENEIKEVTSFEHVLANINKLNRSLEAVVAVGNEFSSVEALWSQFENVMAKDEESKTASGNEEQEEVGERSTTPKGEPGQQH